MIFKKISLAVSFLMLVFLLSGCFRHEPIRHLASDAVLLVPGQTTKKEVLAFIGEPDERQQAGGEEVWIYYQAQKSLLRKTPYLGDRLGHEDYDVMNVTFVGDQLTSTVYRLFSEEEFKRGAKQE